MLLIFLHIAQTAVIVLNYENMTVLQYCSLVVEVVYIMVLCFATRLLVKEHRARLSEVWYCHKLLYGLNIVTTSAIILIFYSDMVRKSLYLDDNIDEIFDRV